MKYLSQIVRWSLMGILMLLGTGCHNVKSISPSKQIYAIVVHGGVTGGFAAPGAPALCARGQMPAEDAPKVSERISTAVNKGYEILEKGGSADDAVVAAVAVLEDSPLFDAGKGSIVTVDGTIEMDACLMDGKTKAVGAVAAVTRLKNPIKGAKAFLNEHQVLLAGPGAEKKALELDPSLETRDPDYFKVEKRCVSNRSEPAPRHGTVGAVALDKSGNLAAATSTGGYPGKITGRIGDSPLVGAGTYADKDVALSATGIGEYFIRHSITHTIADRMAYLGESLETAAENTFEAAYATEDLKNVAIDISCIRERKASADCDELRKILAKLHALGMGGVIGIDRYGNITDYFLFSAFARGYRRNIDPSPVIKLDGPVNK